MKKKTDVKESLEEQVELHIEDGEELVSVEMTPDQRDRIVKILADEKITAQADKDTEYFQFPFLAYSHRINGRKFGPGKNIVVPGHWVGLIMAQEQSAKDNELGLNTSQKRMYEVMQSGQVVPVRVNK